MSDTPVAVSENPFCAARLRPGGIDYIFSGDGSVAKLVDFLADNGWRGQIIGPHGSGKSTLLNCLLAELRSRGHDVCALTLHDGERSLPKSSRHAPGAVRHKSQRADGTRSVPAAFIAIDGYEQLSYWNRWSLRRRCCRQGWGLIVTAHRSVGFATLHQTEVKFERAWQVAEQLQCGYETCIGRDDVARALQRHSGNVREALFELYDLYELRKSLPTASGK